MAIPRMDLEYSSLTTRRQHISVMIDNPQHSCNIFSRVLPRKAICVSDSVVDIDSWINKKSW